MHEPRLPSAVRKAGEAADAELAKLRQADEGKSGSPEPQQGVQPPAQPPVNTEDQPPEARPQATAEEPPATPPASEEPGDRIDLDWKQEFQALQARYNAQEHRIAVLQGKYDAEVPRLSAENAELKRQLASRPEAPAPGQQPGELSEKEKQAVELYGPEILELIESKSQAIADRIVSEKTKSFDERFTQMDRRSNEDAAAAFFTQLEEAHPDWQAVNVTAAWLKFLNETDPATGLKRGEIVERAQGQNMAGPVIHQLSLFKSRTKEKAGRQAGQTVPADSGAAPPMPEKDERIFKKSVVDRFFRDLALGHWKGREDEAARLERQYDLAGLEGRIDENG